MTRDTGLDPGDDLRAAEYVLGVLPHGERAALARRIATDQALAERVRFWDEQFAPLLASVEPVPPPASLLAAVERRLFPAPAARSPSFRESLAVWRGVSAALAAALVVISLLFIVPRISAPAQETALVAELSGPGEALRLAAFYDSERGILRLNRIAGAPQAMRDFELWLIEGGHPPVSLGTLPPEAVAAVPLRPEIAAKFAAGAVLAVSDEPDGGSPTGQPTGAVLATGKLSAI